jgi:hypothetical protein
MKKLFLLFVISCSMVLHAEIDERVSDVYFANGVDTNESSAYESLNFIIKPTVEKEYSVAYASVHKWGVAYNNTWGTVGKGFFLLDFVESAMQKLQTGNSVLDYISTMSTPLGRLVWLVHNADLKEQVRKYKESIRDGHGVIVIAHSQGNLFTNEAYDALDPWMQQYFHMIGVASPTDRVAGNGPHVSFDNDPVGILGLHAGHDIKNPRRYMAGPNAVGGYIDVPDTLFHSFSYYTDTNLTLKPGTANGKNIITTGTNFSEAHDKIFAFVHEKISHHKYAPSQWQKKREVGTCSAGGCERRIIVEHKYDANLSRQMADIEVFPFSEVLKLYSVPDENNVSHYVKALYGGISTEKVSASNPGVCYVLHGTGEAIAPSRAPTAKNGVVTVGLSWEDADIDLDENIIQSANPA